MGTPAAAGEDRGTVSDGDSVSVEGEENVLDPFVYGLKATSGITSNHRGGLLNVMYILLLSAFYVI